MKAINKLGEISETLAVPVITGASVGVGIGSIVYMDLNTGIVSLLGLTLASAIRSVNVKNAYINTIDRLYRDATNHLGIAYKELVIRDQEIELLKVNSKYNLPKNNGFDNYESNQLGDGSEFRSNKKPISKAKKAHKKSARTADTEIIS